MAYILELKDICKNFNKTLALDNINLNIEEGRIFGLLGPNGAGKSTLIRIITNIIVADSGTINFDNNQNYLSSLNFGYMPEERGLYKKMKVGEQLLYLTRLKGISKQEAKSLLNFWITKFNIGSWLSKNVNELSKGMQQKVQFITTVAHRPKLIILDEPFSGLDPINTNLIKNEIYELANQGATIIFSTHRMEQVEEICEEIALINNGKIILNGKVSELKEMYYKNEYEIQFKNEPEINETEIFKIIDQDQNMVKLKLKENRSSNELIASLMKLDNELIAFNKSLPSINNIFINLVNDQNNE